MCVYVCMCDFGHAYEGQRTAFRNLLLPTTTLREAGSCPGNSPVSASHP